MITTSPELSKKLCEVFGNHSPITQFFWVLDRGHMKVVSEAEVDRGFFHNEHVITPTWTADEVMGWFKNCVEIVLRTSSLGYEAILISLRAFVNKDSASDVLATAFIWCIENGHIKIPLEVEK